MDRQAHEAVTVKLRRTYHILLNMQKQDGISIDDRNQQLVVSVETVCLVTATQFRWFRKYLVVLKLSLTQSESHLFCPLDLM